jgi:hypothetical protein
VRRAHPILAHPQGALPDTMPAPHPRDAAYRLFKADAVPPAAVLATPCRLTQARRAEHPGDVVRVAPDDAVLGFSPLGTAPGPSGNGHGTGLRGPHALASAAAARARGPARA